MGLITEYVEITLHNRVLKHYENLNYKIPKRKSTDGVLRVPYGTKIIVKVKDLSKGSHCEVIVECDCCGISLKNILWKNYLKYVKDDGKYYCQKCANNNYQSWISFEKWCITNNRQDVLNRWDYKLNDCKPNEITYATNKKYYFKCPRGLHESELKNLCSFTIERLEGSISCNKCNSFAQWGIDNIDKDFLEKYWDYDKNDELGINPWGINKRTNIIKVWIKCKNKFHNSYYIFPNSFSNGYRCPICAESKGEKVIYNYFINNKYIFIRQEDYCIFCNKHKNYFIPQMKFNGLIGMGNGLLSYDFYIPKLNLLIEYHGEQHERYVEGFHKSYDDFLKQLEHDKRKCEYALNNNINLLVIWYWDFDRIKEILDRELNLI